MLNDDDLFSLSIQQPLFEALVHLGQSKGKLKTRGPRSTYGSHFRLHYECGVNIRDLSNGHPTSDEVPCVQIVLSTRTRTECKDEQTNFPVSVCLHRRASISLAIGILQNAVESQVGEEPLRTYLIEHINLVEKSIVAALKS